MPEVTITREADGTRWDSGSTVAYRVHLDGQWIGWIGDRRPWVGHGYGGRRWWAVWRQDGDHAARANSFEHRTRRAALEWLLAKVVAEHENQDPQ